ncbi:SGNH hydrolase domain-containing protein [Arthrobacter sp. Soil782]|uniref:SGNH hydrolase domain-containing protein n=1 Tax=Arthrobacter sp. Soil782 TaxID=1736410 RepID=UPI0012F7D9C6|nr:SGNH hydrolase domain-containing protein [Arthrobacter sp. Soil782]
MRAVRSYALGAGVTVLALDVSFSATKLPDLDAGKTVAAPVDQQVLSAPTTSEFVPSNLTPALERAADSTPKVYADGCHGAYETTASPDCTYGDRAGTESTVLFGDSHAAQWFTPLDEVAKEEGKKLISLTKSSCRSVDIPVRGKVSEAYPQCDEWRQDSLERIKTLAPDLVVVSNYGSVYRELGRDLGDFDQAWREGLERTIKELPEGTDVVVLGDTPGWEIAPSVCLSTNLQDVGECESPTEDVVDAEVASIEQEAVQSAGGRYVSPIEWVCQETCSPIAWNLLVYRDTHHLTNEMAGALSGRLQQALDVSAS